MCGIYIAFGLTSVFISSVFLDNYRPKKKCKKPIEKLIKFYPILFSAEAIGKKMMATFYMFKDWKVWCLMPIVALTAFLLAFISTDIPNSFISCLLGVEYVGYWFVCFGIIASIGSYIVGIVAKYIGRIPLFITAFTLVLVIHVFMYFWKPSSDQAFILYGLAFIYGTGKPKILLISVIFNQFSNLN